MPSMPGRRDGGAGGRVGCKAFWCAPSARTCTLRVGGDPSGGELARSVPSRRRPHELSPHTRSEGGDAPSLSHGVPSREHFHA